MDSNDFKSYCLPPQHSPCPGRGSRNCITCARYRTSVDTKRMLTEYDYLIGLYQCAVSVRRNMAAAIARPIQDEEEQDFLRRNPQYTRAPDWIRSHYVARVRQADRAGPMWVSAKGSRINGSIDTLRLIIKDTQAKKEIAYNRSLEAFERRWAESYFDTTF